MRDRDRKEIGRLLSEAAAADRGYASFFDWPIKASKEVNIAALFAMSRLQDGGEKLDKIRPGPDPPDCEAADEAGALVGIEVTELVDSRAIRASKRGNPWVYAAWPREKLVAAIQQIVLRKSALPTGTTDYPRYLLLVHTDETELEIDYLRETLRGTAFAQNGRLTEAYLLVSYDPRIKKYPYLRLPLL